MLQIETKRTCPSASENLPDSKVFGLVVDEIGPIRVAYLDSPSVSHLSAGIEMPKGLNRTNARFSANCREDKCGHFLDNRCSLSKKIVDLLPIVVDTVPKCSIRSTCRWFSEEREQACQRCPQVVTLSMSNKPEVGILYLESCIQK